MSLNKEKIIFLKNICSTLTDMINMGKSAIIDAQTEANYHIGAMQSRYDTFKEEAQYLVAAHQIRLIKIEDDIAMCNVLIKKLSNDNFFFDVVELGALLVIGFEEDGSEKTKAYFLTPGGAGMLVCLEGVNAICVSPNAPVVSSFIGLHTSDEPDLQPIVNNQTNKIVMSIR